MLLAAACLLLAAASRRHTPALQPARAQPISLRQGLSAEDKMTAHVDPSDLERAVAMYAELTGRVALPTRLTLLQQADGFLGGRLTQWRVVKPRAAPDTGISYHRDGRWDAGEIKQQLEAVFASHGLAAVPSGLRYFSLAQLPVAGAAETAAPGDPRNLRATTHGSPEKHPEH